MKEGEGDKEENVVEGGEDGNVEILEKQLSTDGELEKSTDEDLSADLLQLMVPVANDK